MKIWNKIGESIINGVFQGKEYKGKLMNLTEITTVLSRQCKAVQFDEFNPVLKEMYSNEFQSYHEDYSSEIFEKCNKIGLIGVYDGHQGNTASRMLKDDLINEFFFFMNLNNNDIQKSLYDSFVECDNKICSTEKLSGASALLTVLKDNKMYLSNCGDCRAVLATTNKEGIITEIQLTNDHTVANEESKIIHTNQYEEIIENGKIKGVLGLSRSFGDALFKSGGKVLSLIANVRANWNPPYITSKPEITVKEINSKKDKFVVFASSGLWSCLSNFEVVKIVNESLQDGEDPTVNLIAQVLSKSASVGKNFEERLSSVLNTPEGFKKLYFPDITVKVLVFNEENQ